MPPARRHARTKIVATLGPACATDDAVFDLAQAGVDVFRINTAHGDPAEHDEALRRVRRVSQRSQRPLGVLVDLGGPKIRLGELPGDEIQCHEDETIYFVRGDASIDPRRLVTTYAPLVDELDLGDRVMLADGTVALVVEEREPDAVRCRVQQGGTVRSRQGVNLPGVRLSTPALTVADREHAAWAIEAGADFLGLSFVRTAADVGLLRELIDQRGAAAAIIAKIEKPEALDELEAIVEAADGVMIARGDLGVEIDIAMVPVVQKHIIRVAHELQKPVITATQMLDSMHRSQRPTRAEASDVANAILDGSDACMLSGETAIGEYPRQAVEMMNRIALATEPLVQGADASGAVHKLPRSLRPVTQAAVNAAGRMADELGAKMVIVASHSGATALAMSKRRGAVPTIGVSDKPSTLRRMCLYWGVLPVAGTPVAELDELLDHVVELGRRQGMVESGDHVVLVAGTGLKGQRPGNQGHNLILVHEVP